MEQPTPQQPSDNKKIEERKKTSIRTYQTDLTKAVVNKDLSVTEIVIKEESKRRKLFTNINIEAKKNMALIIISALLVIAGGVSIYFLNVLKPNPTIKVQEVEINPLIYTEYQKELFFDIPDKLKLSKAVQEETKQMNLPLGSLIQLYLTQRISPEKEGKAGKSLITIQQLATLLDFRMSDTLLRFLEDNFTFGFHSTTQNSPFLILKTRSFEDTFPEMLKWEETILEDLGSIFIEDNIVLSKDKLRENKYQFKDIVVKNKDVRAILDGGGKILFAYSFLDNETLAITTNKLTLQEIIERLSIIYHTR